MPTEAGAEYALLPYQQRWVEDTSRVKVGSKSRQIGFTWTTAGDAVLDAYGGDMDTWYVSHTQNGAEEFITDCEAWCQTLGIVADDTERYMVDPETGLELPPGVGIKGIQSLRIKFPSGKRISALSSNPRRLRGKRGRVVLDEFAHHPDPQALLKAAMALLIWGGRIEIFSTHNGEGHLFNQIVEGIRKGDEQYEGWSLHEVTFDQAIEQGFGKRLFQKLGWDWSPEAEKEWRDMTVRDYGVSADEELFCKPVSASDGAWFHRDKFSILDSLTDFGKPFPRVKRRVRAWDWAATVKSASSPDPDWTVGVLVAELDTGAFVVEDVVRDRLGPADVDRLLVQTAERDGRDVEIVLALDPGAAAKSDIHHKERLLTGHIVSQLRVTKSKDDYAKVWASIVARGDLYLMRRHWNQAYLNELHQYPSKGVHDDQVDATSYAFQQLTGASSARMNTWLAAMSNR